MLARGLPSWLVHLLPTNVARVRLWLISAGLVLSAVIFLGALLSLALTRSAPDWWQQIRTSDQRVNIRAIEIENRTFQSFSKVRPAAANLTAAEPYRSDVWSLPMTDAEASAWLTTRLPLWLDGQPNLPDWPDTLSQLQVDFADGIARIGIRVDHTDPDRVLSATFAPRIDENGSFWLDPQWVHVGRLPVPAPWILEREDFDVSKLLPAEMVDDASDVNIVGIIRGQEPIAAHPVITLADERQVRLLGLRVNNGKLELVCQTEVRVEEDVAAND